MSTIEVFDNILNVRDFGGQAMSGGRVKTGALYRGAQLSAMSDGDRTKLSGWDISLVVDMRYRSERARQPSNFTAPFTPEILEIPAKHDLPETQELAPHEQFMLHDLQTEEDGQKYMANSYKERPHRAGFVALTSRTFARLAAGEDVLYVHCAAGKDRTGLFCALLLLALGVSHDDVMEDYLATRSAVDLEMFLGMMATKMEDRYGRSYDPAALRPFLSVEPEYLLSSLKIAGDVGAYWHDVLGLSTDQLTALRKRYTA